MVLAKKKVLVVGLGVTGVAVAQFLKRREAVVVVTDQTAKQKLEARAQTLRKMDITVELGRHRSETFEQAELIVLSPGVSHTIAPVLRAKRLGIPVIGEIELASRFIQEPIVAVTGTNGKTTTTQLLGNMLQNCGFNVFIGGNIGRPLIDCAGMDQKADMIVAEISSFQLDTIDTFKPKIGVLLNITMDHQDRYPNFSAYTAAKMRLFKNQRPEDIAVLNGADPVVRSLTERLKSQKLYYGLLNDQEEGATINGNGIRFRFNESIGGEHESSLYRGALRNRGAINVANAKLADRHNLENVSAACLAALAAGGGPRGIQRALDQYQGAAHRLEHIDTIHGVDFFNDSKATNVDAVKKAVQSFSKPVVLIMGGLDKGGDFHALRKVIARHAKNLIVMGKSADLIQSALGDIVPTVPATSMADAIKQAYRVVSPGNVVLLSPGCASFDMYSSYAQRGDDFKKAVKNLRLQKR
jgi:UDP-N-acetylmuramoylalanine--D-glutamate ligase